MQTPGRQRRAGNRTFSKSTDEVWLVSGRFVSFSSAPRSRLLDGLERIADIRHDITRHAKVASMPPVEVVPYIWQDATGLILGQTTHLGLGIDCFLGVRIPAQTAVCGDTDAVRAVLVHEFAHCFYFTKVIIDAFDGHPNHLGGLMDLSALINAPDVAMLADPTDWFGEDDAREFIYSDDCRTRSIQALVPSLLRQFRIATPETTISLVTVQIKNHLKEHVRALRRRNGPRI